MQRYKIVNGLSHHINVVRQLVVGPYQTTIKIQDENNTLKASVFNETMTVIDKTHTYTDTATHTGTGGVGWEWKV